MDIWDILLIGICVSLLSLVLYKSKDISQVMILAACLVILLFSMQQMKKVTDFIAEVRTQTNLSSQYMTIIYKIMGISILGEFSISVCNDNHHGSLAKALDFGCKCSILVTALPIFTDVLSIINGLLK